MKKILCLSLLFLFVFMVSQSFAGTEDDKAKINNEIRRLTEKLKASNVKSHRVKIQQLILTYKQRLARMQETELLTQSGKNIYAFEGITPSIGFGGGSALLSIGYRRVSPMLMHVGVGYGFGNSFSLLEGRAGVGYLLSDKNYIALDLTYASYSKKVEGVMGVSGTLGAGGSIGIGAVYGHRINENILTEVGYSTNLGAIVKVGYIL